MLKAFLLLVALYLAVAVGAKLTADRQIFFPPPPSYSARDLPVSRVKTSDGGDVAVLHLPNQSSRVTMLVSHGNAEDLGWMAPFLFEMREAGFSVLAYDYRGYGASSGPAASEARTYRDIEAVYRHARENLGIAPESLVLYGRSVGAGPSIHLAARERVGGLIIESGFTSAFVVVTRVPIFPFDAYPNLRRIGKVECPLLIVHGAADDIIPPRHARALYAAAPEPKRLVIVPGAGHNDLAMVAGDSYWPMLRDFARDVVSRGANKEP